MKRGGGAWRRCSALNITTTVPHFVMYHAFIMDRFSFSFSLVYLLLWAYFLYTEGVNRVDFLSTVSVLWIVDVPLLKRCRLSVPSGRSWEPRPPFSSSGSVWWRYQLNTNCWYQYFPTLSQLSQTHLKVFPIFQLNLFFSYLFLISTFNNQKMPQHQFSVMRCHIPLKQGSHQVTTSYLSWTPWTACM